MSLDGLVPTIEELDQEACEALLQLHHVGRLAFTFKDRVDIEPISFVFADGAIYGRTQLGEKVRILSHHPWVAFEIDEVQSLVQWQSVVVHGRIDFPDPEGPPLERAAHEKALAAIRTLHTDAFTDADPTPHRDLVFCIHVLEMRGRRSYLAPKSR